MVREEEKWFFFKNTNCPFFSPFYHFPTGVAGLRMLSVRFHFSFAHFLWLVNSRRFSKLLHHNISVISTKRHIQNANWMYHCLKSELFLFLILTFRFPNSDSPLMWVRHRFSFHHVATMLWLWLLIIFSRFSF